MPSYDGDAVHEVAVQQGRGVAGQIVPDLLEPVIQGIVDVEATETCHYQLFVLCDGQCGQEILREGSGGIRSVFVVLHHVAVESIPVESLIGGYPDLIFFGNEVGYGGAGCEVQSFGHRGGLQLAVLLQLYGAYFPVEAYPYLAVLFYVFEYQVALFESGMAERVYAFDAAFLTEGDAVELVSVVQPEASVGILLDVKGGSVGEPVGQGTQRLGRDVLQGLEVNEVYSPFRSHPQAVEAVFAGTAHEVALQFAVRNAGVEMDELVSVVS